MYVHEGQSLVVSAPDPGLSVSGYICLIETNPRICDTASREDQ